MSSSVEHKQTTNCSNGMYEVSFVIPVFNEEQFIGHTISRIQRYGRSLDRFEIIVIDNGSNDLSASIAESLNARVIVLPGKNVATLRNEGARQAKYRWLVFLDADVYLTEEWGKEIRNLLKNNDNKKFEIFGSTCGISENPSWVERCWWGARKTKSLPAKYLNSGHMIIKKDTFVELGGFDESMITGEDVEFCQRKRSVEVIVNDCDFLPVTHEGYPKTSKQFFRRERWHGVGDYRSLKIFLRSIPAILSMGMLLVTMVTPLLLAYSGTAGIIPYITYSTLVCSAAAARHKRVNKKDYFCRVYLYYLYFNARSVSFLDVFLFKKIVRMHRVSK